VQSVIGRPAKRCAAVAVVVLADVAGAVATIETVESGTERTSLRARWAEGDERVALDKVAEGGIAAKVTPSEDGAR